MIVPLKWLKDYVDVDMSIRDFMEGMTMSGSKIETIDYPGKEIINVVVGQIRSIEKHPNADKLVVCLVDIGKTPSLQIVTGASNLKVGDKVPVALDGALLPGGKQIKTGELRNVLSEGMLCSLSELGLTLHDYPDAVEDGIFVLTDPCELGEDIREALGMNVAVVEFEITPNRPDCLSILGIAREAQATFNLPLIMPKTSFKEDKDDSIKKYLSVTVEDKALCSRYTARVVKNVKIKPSPTWLRVKLRNAGVRPINNIVDITNYVMLEYGQPMHAFDYRTVKNGHLLVRAAKQGEELMTLDGVTRKLEPFMTVIADGERPIAIAGIMGGEESGISNDTTTVVFESATFAGPSIRKTSNALGLRSEASSRFEKGLDPQLTEEALERACHLIEELSAGEIVSGHIDIDYSDKTLRTIPLRPKKINEFLGTDIPESEMKKILEKLFFKVSPLSHITVPSFRSDVEGEADIAEEIARIYGYNEIPTTLFSGATAQGKYSERQKFEQKLHGILTALGLNEISTYSFVSPKSYDKINLPENDPRRDSVKIKNPLGEDTSIMRTTILPSMLDTLSTNYNRRNASAALYEIGTVYLPIGEDLPKEQNMLAIGLYGDYDYYFLKGLLEELLHNIGINGVGLTGFGVKSVEDNPSFHPGRTAAFTRDGDTFAILGQIHPEVCENFSLPAKTFAAVIDFEKIYTYSSAEKQYRPLGKFPASTRDLSLLCDENVKVLEIMKIISEAGGETLKDIKLFDVYVGKQIPEGKKSISFSLSFRSDDRTLTVEEVDQKIKDIISSLEQKSGILLRTL